MVCLEKPPPASAAEPSSSAHRPHHAAKQAQLEPVAPDNGTVGRISDDVQAGRLAKERENELQRYTAGVEEEELLMTSVVRVLDQLAQRITLRSCPTNIPGGNPQHRYL